MSLFDTTSLPGAPPPPIRQGSDASKSASHRRLGISAASPGATGRSVTTDRAATSADPTSSSSTNGRPEVKRLLRRLRFRRHRVDTALIQEWNVALQRELAQLRLRHLSAVGEIEHCRRNHASGPVAVVQAQNIRLAHQADQADARRDAAILQHAHVARLAALYRQQLVDLGIKPRALEPAGEH